MKEEKKKQWLDQGRAEALSRGVKDANAYKKMLEADKKRDPFAAAKEYDKKSK